MQRLLLFSLLLSAGALFLLHPLLPLIAVVAAIYITQATSEGE